MGSEPEVRWDSNGKVIVPKIPTPKWKRTMDVVGAVGGLIVLSPLLIGAAILTRVTLGPGILFTQKRGAHGGGTFQIIKFRTMTEDRDAEGVLLPDAERIHWWGDMMRRFSIDELPGLINVLRGEMSLVGPRPFYAIYLERYTPEHAQRHQVVPGITGLSQTQGRNALTWDEKFELDLDYVRRRSFLLDVRILWSTVAAVLHGRGADGAKLTTVYAGIDGTQTHGQE
jgi:sugar transferase EpsL